MLSLNGNLIWNKNDNNSPSDFPTESNWENSADLTITSGATESFTIQFRENLQPSGYEVHIFFNIGCQVSGTK